MKRNIVVTVVILLLATVAATAFLLNSTTQTSNQSLDPSPLDTPADTIDNDIVQDFADKYDKDPSDIQITVDVNTGSYAKGSIRFTDEFGGAIWFGVKQDAEWVLAADGQGPMLCAVAEKYSFPSDLVPECISESGELINR